MPTNVDNVQVVKRVRLYVAAITVTAPTTFSSPLTSFVDLGGMDADGFTVTPGVETESFVDADGDTYAEVIKSSSVEIKFALTESAAAQLEYYFGAAPISGGGYVIDPTLTGGKKQLVRDAVMASGLIARRLFPRTELIKREEIVTKGGQPEKWAVTAKAYPGTVAPGRTAPGIEWRGTPA